MIFPIGRRHSDQYLSRSRFEVRCISVGQLFTSQQPRTRTTLIARIPFLGVAVSGRLRYGLREDLRLFVPAARAKFFTSASAVISLVVDTSFFDCWTISASFAFTRLVISRLSPVLGMFPPHERDVQRLALRASDLRSTERSGEIRLSFWA